MTGVITFLLTYWRYAAGGAVVIAIGLFVWHLDDAAWQRGSDARAALDKPVIDRLTMDNGTLKANQTTLQASLDAQNAAVAALKTSSDQRAADAAKALAGLRAASTKAATLSAQVLALKPGVDVCKSADALMLGSLAP